MKIQSKQTLWEQYGKVGIAGLIVLIIIYGAFQYYQHYKTKQTLAASTIYEEMLLSVRQKNIEKAKKSGVQLIENYAKTPYAPLAALMLARFAIDDNALEMAKEQLRFAMDTKETNPISHIARVRLARVLIDQKNYDEALTILMHKSIPKEYVALYEEAKGDIFLLKNEQEKAKAAYQAAIEALPPGVPVNRLQLKQSAIGSKGGS